MTIRIYAASVQNRISKALLVRRTLKLRMTPGRITLTIETSF
jgi:hypothetical protein